MTSPSSFHEAVSPQRYFHRFHEASMRGLHLVRRMPDVGIWMRPDVFKRKSSGTSSSWYFRDSGALRSDEPEEFRVKPGDRLWVSVTDRWVGYFTVNTVRPENYEVDWDPSSWVAVTYPLEWPSSYQLVDVAGELRHGYTHHVPQLPLPDSCEQCGGPTYMWHMYEPPDRRCFGCHSDPKRCTCKPAVSTRRA